MTYKKRKFDYKFIHFNNLEGVSQIDSMKNIYRNYDKKAKFRTISIIVNGEPSLATFVYLSKSNTKIGIFTNQS